MHCDTATTAVFSDVDQDDLAPMRLQVLAPSRLRALAQRASTPVPCLTAPLRDTAVHSNVNNAAGSPAPDVLAARRQLVSGGLSEEQAEACLATFVPICQPVATKRDVEQAVEAIKHELDALKLQLLFCILVSGLVFCG